MLTIFKRIEAQVDFALTNTVCAGDTLSLVANTGSFNATSYLWTATPSGAWFASASANHTDLSFSASGIYTIDLSVSNGTAVNSASHVVVVYAQPTISVVSTHTLLCAGEDATLSAFGAGTFFWAPQNQVSAIAINQVYINPYVTTNFTVIGVDNLGCKNVAYFTQQVVNYPNIQINASSNYACAGSSATLQALGAASFTWSGGSLVNVTQSSVAVGAGSYTVVGSNGGVCNDTTSYSVLSSNPPNINVLMDRSVRCIKDTVLEPGISLTASGASTYTWMPYHPGEMTYSIGPSTYVTPTVSTCYTLMATASSCTGSLQICVEVSECVGVEESSLVSNRIGLFPNPAHELVYVRWEGEAFELHLSDVMGRMVLEKKQNSGNGEPMAVDIRELQPGLYFLVVLRNGNSETLRLLKE